VAQANCGIVENRGTKRLSKCTPTHPLMISYLISTVNTLTN